MVPTSTTVPGSGASPRHGRVGTGRGVPRVEYLSLLGKVSPRNDEEARLGPTARVAWGWAARWRETGLMGHIPRLGSKAQYRTRCGGRTIPIL